MMASTVIGTWIVALATLASEDETQHPGLPEGGSLKRIAALPSGAEVTGLLELDGDLFFNVQHPADDLPNEFRRASVGVIANADLTAPETPAPTELADRQRVTSNAGAYQILLQEGDHGCIGAIRGPGGEVKVSNDPDFNAFVPTGPNRGYLFTNWEDRPGGMSRAALSRSADGTWSVEPSDVRMLDFAPVRGTWVNCFGSLSPWNTPLTSEELYFDHTSKWNDPEDLKQGTRDLALYLAEFPNPYDYGYIVEILDPAGVARPVKRHPLGRFSHENCVVMPDQRTVYLNDDGEFTVFFKFIADRAGDLSSGTLFAAQATQLAPPGSDAATTAFRLAWIELAHGTADEIHGWIREYDGITPDDHVEGGTSYISDEEIRLWAEGEAPDDRVAFLESRKAARARGATAEFQKMEGANIHQESARDGSVPFLYMTMSFVKKGMSDDKGALQVQRRETGVVYRMRLDSNYNVSKMVPVIAGGAWDEHATPDKADVNWISNPDNIVVLRDGRVIVSEDSGKNHSNDAVWLYTPASDR